MATTLTSRERVNRAMERRDQDRVPRHDSYWKETIDRWQAEGLNGDQDRVLEMLRSDFRSLCWVWPAPLAGREETVRYEGETRIVRDGQGKLVRYWRDKSGTPEHLGFECDSREVWEKRFKPALLASGLQVDAEAARRRWLIGREKGLWTHIGTVEGFECTRGLMGDEITLMAMADDPEWVRDVSRTYCDAVLRNMDAVMATGARPDGLWLYGDMAYKTSTICSPAMYRELIWPDHKRFADWAHAHEMKLIFHTDGDVNAVMDLYAQAGFDCIQPLECKAGMDIRKLVCSHGDKLTFFGNVDAMTLVTNDPGRVEAEVVAKLKAGMSRRGYIYHSDHSVPLGVSWATYKYIIELLDKHGNY